MDYLKTLLILLLCLLANTPADAAEPALRHVFDIHAQCAEAMCVGDIPGGKRIVIPIVGGSVDGAIDADILPGGADCQLIDTISGRTTFDADYSIKTRDGIIINVRNTGIGTGGAQGDYFVTAPSFEAPLQSPYAWLNNRLFICKPLRFDPATVHLRVWLVE